MAKSAYYGKNLIDEISAGIALICEQRGYCTPTDVLRLVGIDETILTRQIVCDIALIKSYDIKPSGRGYRIFDNRIPF